LILAEADVEPSTVRAALKPLRISSIRIKEGGYKINPREQSSSFLMAALASRIESRARSLVSFFFLDGYEEEGVLSHFII
jgi:hypothetical protein